MRFALYAAWLLWASLVLATVSHGQETGFAQGPYWYLTAQERALHSEAITKFHRDKPRAFHGKQEIPSGDARRLLFAGRVEVDGKIIWVDEGLVCPLPLTMKGQEVWESMCNKVGQERREWYAHLDRVGREAREKNAKELEGLVP